MSIVNRILSRLLPAIILAALSHFPAWGEPVDSLYNIYLNADKTQQAEAVNQVSRILHDEGITDSLYQCDKSMRQNKIDATMHYLMAEYHYAEGRYESALEEGKAAQELLDLSKANKFTSDALGLLSNIQYRIGDYDEALKTLLAVYKNDKKLKDEKLISSDLNSLAAIYLAIEEPVKGIEFINKAIDIERELKRPDRLSTRLGMASELYLINHEPEKAMEAIDEAIEIDRQGGHPQKIAIRLVQKAAVLENLAEYDKAKAILQQTLAVLEEAGNTYSLAVAYNLLGKIEHQCGNGQEAAAHYKQALEESIKCGATKVERTAERGLWEVLRESNPGVALLHLERYQALNDSMLVEMASTRLAVMEITNQDIEENEIAKKSQLVNKLIKWGGLALLLMLAAILLGVFHSRRSMKKALAIQQQAEDQRSYFFTNITNKLQTPLAIVLNAGHQLLEGGRNTTEELKRLGEMIVYHGENMLGMVNQLLDIENVKTQIEAPEYKLGNIVLFVRLLVDNFATTAREKLIDLKFESPTNSLTVVFVPDYIRKIVHTLIDNALKFTPRNGNVTVKLENPETTTMRLTVNDSGVGIPVEERSRLFKPFTQSERDNEGVNVGLGLTLVHQIVQAMNGSISVNSELGQGTTFTIDFPVRIEDDNIAADEDTQQFTERYIKTDTSRHKPLVFVVDSDDELTFFVASHLDENYHLRLERNGKDALQNAHDMVPDLMITGMNLPVMDGKALIEQVRSDASLNHIPIIAMTSSTSEQTRMACIRAGADAVLVKPFNSGELRLLTQHLIQQSATMRKRFSKAQAVMQTEAPNNKLSKEDTRFINKLVDVINAHMSKNDTDIDHIAAALSMSRKQLRSRVMAITGLTPVAFSLQVRLNSACHMVATEDTPLNVIAKRCGFLNSSHFSKAFKQQFGMSPQQYRKQAEDNSHPPLPHS